jgi:hypothetical protein
MHWCDIQGFVFKAADMGKKLRKAKKNVGNTMKRKEREP